MFQPVDGAISFMSLLKDEFGCVESTAWHWSIWQMHGTNFFRE
jgi:hypothetical protein